MPIQLAEHDPNKEVAKPCPEQVLPLAPGSASYASTTSQEEGAPHALSPVSSGPINQVAGESSRSTQPAQNILSLRDAERDAEDCQPIAVAAGSKVELYSPKAAGTAPSCSTAESSKTTKPAKEGAEDDWEDGSEVDSFNDRAIAAVEAELVHHPEIGDPQKLQDLNDDVGLPDPRKRCRQADMPSTANGSAELDDRKMKLPSPLSGAPPVQFAIGPAGSSSYKVTGTASLPSQSTVVTGDRSSPRPGSSSQTSLPGTLFCFLSSYRETSGTCSVTSGPLLAGGLLLVMCGDAGQEQQLCMTQSDLCYSWVSLFCREE